MFVNPGGPGDTGFGLVTARVGTRRVGRGRFNVVGYDPRGTTPAPGCGASAAAEAWSDSGGRDDPQTRGPERFRRKTAALARRCRQVSGGLLATCPPPIPPATSTTCGASSTTAGSASWGSPTAPTWARPTPTCSLPGAGDGPRRDCRTSRVGKGGGGEARQRRLLKRRGLRKLRVALPGRRADPLRTRRPPVRGQGGSRTAAGAPPSGAAPGSLGRPAQASLPIPTCCWPCSSRCEPGGMAQAGRRLAAALAGDGSALETRARLMRSPQAWWGWTTSRRSSARTGPPIGAPEWPRVIGVSTAASCRGRSDGGSGRRAPPGRCVTEAAMPDPGRPGPRFRSS